MQQGGLLPLALHLLEAGRPLRGQAFFLNRHVVSVESNVEPATDFCPHDMKKRRLKLKDQLYDILKSA